jgi:hypothetical protein
MGILLRSLGCLLLCIMAVNTAIAAQTLRVAISNPEIVDINDTKYYYENLLTLALEKTRKTDGDFVIDHKPNNGGASRERAILEAGAGIDVTWGTATAERVETMRVVPVNLLKNMNNFRVLLINAKNQAAFNGVNSLQDLQKFSAGGGAQWTDTAILKANGINVKTTTSYQGVIKMLAAERFDFMSRGLYEVNFDLTSHPDLALALETHVLLKYENPLRFCFFVNKNNPKLADRIERGLKIAKKDGSFDNLFNQIPSLRQGMELLKNSQRTAIILTN